MTDLRSNAPEPGEEAPRFWRSWKRLYTTLLLYWVLLLLLMYVGTRLLSR